MPVLTAPVSLRLRAIDEIERCSLANSPKTPQPAYVGYGDEQTGRTALSTMMSSHET